MTLITKSLIDQACDDMTPIHFTDLENQPGINSSLTIGTQLFELYLALQQFYTLGFTILQKKDENNSGTSQDFTVFHSWFLKVEMVVFIKFILHKKSFL